MVFRSSMSLNLAVCTVTDQAVLMGGMFFSPVVSRKLVRDFENGISWIFLLL